MTAVDPALAARLAGARGVLFDKDGTLFDFQKSWGGFGVDLVRHLAAGDAALAERLAEAAGLDMAAGRYAAHGPIVSGRVQELVAAWSALLPHWRPDALIGEIAARARALAQTGLAPATDDLPGLLATLRAKGLALGVATHDAAGSADAHLRRAGARDAFRFLAGADSGFALKPDPAMLNAFCREAGLQPAEVVVVGDSLADLGMGRAGGACAAIGVLTGPADAALLGPNADLVLGSIAELPALLGG